MLKSDGSSLSSHPDTFAEIEEKIRHSLAMEGLRTVTRHTPRTFRAFTIPTSVAFSQDEAGVYTSLEISTADRPGLLARLGSVLSEHQVSIQGAKIQTLGERVEDVFFLTDAAGGPLRDTDSLARIEQQLITLLEASRAEDDSPSEIAI